MISPPHSGSWIWGPERGGGGRTLSPSEHRAQPSPAASASASLPVSAEPHPLPSSPPSRLSSGKLQEFGVGDGSKLTLVPTVEAGLMVNGWGPVPWRLRRGRAAPSRQHRPVTHIWNPLPAREAPQLTGPPSSCAQALAGSGAQGHLPPLFVVSGLEARTVCDAGPGELDGDPGETRPPRWPAGSQAQCPAPLGSLGLFVLPGGLWGGDGRDAPPRLPASLAWSSSFLFLLPPALTT